MTALLKYDAALRAVAEAHRIDEVKQIRDVAIAAQAYARQAKDSRMITKATEIRKRAERRAGELLIEMQGRKERRGQSQRSRGATSEILPPSLSALGVSKTQSSRWQKVARIPSDKFQRSVERAKRLALAALEGDRAFIAEMRLEQVIEKKKRRLERERELAEGTRIASRNLDKKLYGVIYADPPWRYDTPPMGDVTRATEVHYPTMEIDAIRALTVPAHDDCVLFLWATIPLLPRILDVTGDWRFDYKSASVWHKHKPGTGYWVRSECELLLICTRGSVPAPAPGGQFPAHIEAPSRRHSEKPAVFAEEIERLFPNVPKLEMFARSRRDGWDIFSNEVAEASE